MQNDYRYEGALINTGRNRRLTKDSYGLYEALETGEVVEGTGFLCDSDKNLHVRLGEFCGVIPAGECVYTAAGLPEKDIAVISRVGKPVCCKIKAIDSCGGSVFPLLSRRDAQREAMREYVSRLCPGDVIEAKITRLDPFGAFCDIGRGIISLLPIDCMSVSRITHPKDRFRNGQIIKAVVRSGCDEYGRIALTHRELLGTWEENAAAFSPGQTAAGVIRSVEDYGIFVELAPNLAGLAECREGAEVGQTAAVYIKSIIPERMKIKLAIIDCSDTRPEAAEYTYPDVTHIDRWRYSPEGCRKTVETVFNT